MALFEFSFQAAQAAREPVSYAIPIGVVVAAGVAGLFSLVSLIISKENKVTEFRQAWIDAQRNDLAELLATATALETAPLKKRADTLAAFDRSFARILLRDNPVASVKRSYAFTSKVRWKLPSWKNWAFVSFTKPTDPPLPWGKVTASVAGLRNELGSARSDSQAILRHKTEIIREARRLLKIEWGIVKDGERWYSITRHFVGGFVITCLVVVVLMTLVIMTSPQ